MAEKTLNTIIVLRNDKSTDWATSDVILKEGEVGVSYLENGNVVVKAGDGVNKWPQLKQVEGVFEQPVTLTQNFGYYNDVPTGGYKTYANTEGMTTSEFLLSALKKTVEPTITQPSVSLGASAVVENSDTEIGAKITGLTWDGTNNKGSYKIGSASQTTGITDSNFSWTVSNNIDTSTSTKVDGTFTLSSTDYIQINTDGEATYATVSAVVEFSDASVKDPKNNLGENTSGKITATTASAPWSKSASVKVTGYRKPFWGVIAATDGLKAPTAYTSDDVRALPNNAKTAGGFPTTLAVPEGSQMVVFFAKHGVKSSLSATDAAAQNATVAFTKVENAVRVKGAHDFVPANATGDDVNGVLYDLWYVDWKSGIDSAKSLNLAWA